ncbi:hypothetical protein FRC03_009405 [Tulasnella sp. 419]|nr:hypothetical protein FRC02_009397 [Tulasnella sp. 418]KAG8967712.1 hypothetical protein FRC03_009405 [Tulasnella sp. 419]
MSTSHSASFYAESHPSEASEQELTLPEEGSSTSPRSPLLPKEPFRCSNLSCHHTRGEHHSEFKDNKKVLWCRTCQKIHPDNPDPCREDPITPGDGLQPADMAEIEREVQEAGLQAQNKSKIKLLCCGLM